MSDLTPGDRIRSRRAKRFVHFVERDQIQVWTNVGWRHVGFENARARIEWRGGEPEIPVNFDYELAVILQARGDLDDREGVAG